MGRILEDLFGHLLQHLLGVDGMVAAALLAGALWFGHYAVRASGPRRRERFILVPFSVAFFVAAAVVCSVTKFLVLMAVALLAYFISVNRPPERRDG